jgi:hypothetical protein
MGDGFTESRANNKIEESGLIVGNDLKVGEKSALPPSPR